MQLEKIQYGQPLSPSQVEKIGQAIVFLSQKIKPLYKTKTLKLLYLLEETSIRQYGVPFFGVDFELWRLGPVVKDVFIDLSTSGEPELLQSFVSTKDDKDGKSLVPKIDFNDDEFTDCDMKVLDTVVSAFKDTAAAELVQITHREKFPWYETAKAAGVLDMFNNKSINSTDIIIDLSMLLDGRPTEKEFYLSTLQFQKQSNHLKGLF